MKRTGLLVALFIAFFVIGCGDEFTGGSLDSAPGGGFGGTPGGAQDVSQIRQMIDNGEVPRFDDFLIEGIFSEYDLPIDGPPPDRTLTVRAAHGYAAEDDLPAGGLYVQVGLSSSLNIETFRRTPLNLSLVIDRSGSMRHPLGDSTSNKLEAVKIAAAKLVDQLNEEDILSIVLFDVDLDILAEPAPVVDKDHIKELISTIELGGNTNMDLGLRQGYRFVRQNLENGDRIDKVMMFTDALPNEGNLSDENFRAIVDEGAADFIGLTVFGVGLRFNSQLTNFIATRRGGSFYYLEDHERIKTIFDEDFEFMASDLAYDLVLEVDAGQGFDCDAAYGFPGGAERMEVKTVMLSRKRGALLLHFSVPAGHRVCRVANGAHIADIHLEYIEVTGERREDDLHVVYSGEDVHDANAHYFEQPGARLCAALAREMIAMSEACRKYHNHDVPGAATMLNSLEMHLVNENMALTGGILDREIRMTRKLRRNMLSGTES